MQLSEVKLALANRYLEQAMHWDTIMGKKKAPKDSPRWNRITVLLNRACKAELEAYGFKVYTYHESYPGLAGITSYHPGPTYPDGCIPLPYQPQSPGDSGLYH